MSKLIMRIVMGWVHRQYVKLGDPIYYIKGVGADYPRYLLFTEDEDVYKRMDCF